MAWYPTRISTRLTIGGILLLAVTTLVIVVIMLWRGQPRVVEINTALIEETGQGLTRQLSTVLSRIEVRPSACRDWLKCYLTMNLCTKALFRILLVKVKTRLLPAAASGQNQTPSPQVWRKEAFSGRVMLKESWCIPMIITSKDRVDTTMKAGINWPKAIHKTAVYGLTFTGMPVQASTW